VPGGNLAALTDTERQGNRSIQKKKVGVVLKTRERSPGACRPQSSTDTFSLTLLMVDDDGHVVHNETRSGLACNRRVGQEQFKVTYGVNHCAGSKAPNRRSDGIITITATTEDGELVETRTIMCKQ
jgi:hypothetical protein